VDNGTVTAELSASVPEWSLGSRRRWLALVAVSLAYFFSGRLGLKLAIVNPSATTVWPPTGIALFAFLALGYDAWPAILIGAFAVNATSSGSFFASLGIAVGNTLEGAIGSYLVIRFAKGREAFLQFRSVFRFALFAAGISTIVSATIGTSSLCLAGLAGWREFASIWLAWWLGDAGGDLLVAPLLILWSSRPRLSQTRARLSDRLLLLTGVSALAILAFCIFPGGVWDYSWALIAIPVLAWSASKFAPHEALSATCLFAGIAIWGTVHGPGVFPKFSLTESLLLLQAYLGTVAVTTLTLSAVASERNRDEAALRGARDELETRVRERTGELRELLRKLLDAQDDERRRLSCELHEGAAQDLVAIKMNLELARDETAAPGSGTLKALDDALWLTDQAIKEIRTLAYLLYPPTLDNAGLTSAIASYAEGFARRSGTNTAVDVDKHLGRLPRDIEVALFHVVQETLTNIHRHAKSPSATIVLQSHSSEIRLEVRDDGQGIAAGELGRKEALGVGIRGMRQTIGLLGGRFEIEPANPGTIVRAVIPMPNGSANLAEATPK
jgi:signal transduction histidine kinase